MECEWNGMWSRHFIGYLRFALSSNKPIEWPSSSKSETVETGDPDFPSTVCCRKVLYWMSFITCNSFWKPVHMFFLKSAYYEWAKQTKFLLTVIYGSPRQHSDSSNLSEKSEKMEINFYDQLNRLKRWTARLTAYFLESLKDGDVKFWRNLHSSLQFGLSKFGLDIFVSLATMRFSTT